jgi:hypothetical protein
LDGISLVFIITGHAITARWKRIARVIPALAFLWGELVPISISAQEPESVQMGYLGKKGNAFEIDDMEST